MKNEAKIAVVVVAYNRKDMLIDCLHRILKQTRPVDRIFLIDNASTDGTDVAVTEAFGNNPVLSYTKLSENTGSSGGFHDGSKMAYEWGADWIWFLDDDVAPSVDCLEVLMKYEHISKCIHPNKMDKNGNEFMWESVFDPSMVRATFFNNISFRNGKDFTFMNMGCFEGMLIHRDVVSKIGFPDKRFFICSDDTLYGFIASLYTNVILVKDAILDKQFVFNNTTKPIFLYYYIRNQFLIKEYLKKYNLFKGYLFYLGLSILTFSALVKHTIKSKNLRTPLFVIRALVDGTRGKFYKIDSVKK